MRRGVGTGHSGRFAKFCGGGVPGKGENGYVLSSHRSGKSRVSRFVLGFYRSEEHGREALREARNDGFRRSAVIYRSPDGELSHFHDGLGPRERAAFGVAMALAVAVLAAIGGVPPLAVAPLAVCGFLIIWFGTLVVRTRDSQQSSSCLPRLCPSRREPRGCRRNRR